MNENMHPMAAPAPITSVPKEKRRYRWFKFAVSLAVVHVAIGIQMIPVIGVFAAIYLSFPPILFFVAYDTAGESPLFATVALGTSLPFYLGLRCAWRESVARWPHLGKWLAMTTLAIWIPVGCGDAIRWSLMQTRIGNTDPQCYETSSLLASLLASLRQRYSLNFDGSREPHAWMVRNGEVWLWSYRSLRFEAAPEWYRASSLIEACRQSPQ